MKMTGPKMDNPLFYNKECLRGIDILQTLFEPFKLSENVRSLI